MPTPRRRPSIDRSIGRAKLRRTVSVLYLIQNGRNVIMYYIHLNTHSTPAQMLAHSSTTIIQLMIVPVTNCCRFDG